MPGLTVAAGSNRPSSSELESAHQPCLYDGRYKFQEYDFPSHSLATAHYSVYPFEVLEFDSAEAVVAVEGVIYNRDSETLEEEIQIHLTDGIDTESISDWIHSLDGEFVFYAYDADTGEITIVSDLLGQLPLFYATNTSGYALLGRNKFVLERLTDHTEFDRLAIAQYLRIGYALTDRTLFSDIRRVPDGTIVRIDAGTGTIDFDHHHQFNFSTESNRDQSVATNARRLAKRFTVASNRRANACPGRNVLLLSGGLDSRGVMGAFEQANADYVAVTRDFKHDSRADIEVAGELAEAVGSDWLRVHTPPPTGADLLDHLDMTAGTDPFNIAHIQPFLRRTRKTINGTTWGYTGDGGDKLLPDLSPVSEINSQRELAEYVVTTESKFSTEDVEAMTGVSESEILASVEDRLETYPESTPTKQFLHYELFERAFAWLFEATDTNRNHMWTTSPYYALDVLEYALNCPDEQKRRYRLFTAFLQELSPDLARVRNANIGAAPSNRSHTIRYGTHEMLQRYPGVLDRVLPLAKRALGTETDANPNPVLLRCLREQLQRNSLDVVVPEAISQTVLADTESYSRYDLCLLFTLVSVLDQCSEPGVLEEYREARFD